MKFYYVYILQSKSHGRFYTGMSSDPDKRLSYHNEGLNTSTRTGCPWERVWLSKEMDKSSALSLERKIKKRGVKRYLESRGIL